LTIGILVVGGGLVYYVIRERSKAAAATTSGLSGGTTVPVAVTTTGGTTGPTTLAAWIQDALSQITSGTYTSSEALNDINSWLGGNCVSKAGYSAIGNLVASLGEPPGYSTLPVLSVCPTTPGTTTTKTTTTTPKPASSTDNAPGAPPNLPTALRAAMTGNGESIISTEWDPILREWIFATNKGGIYNLSPSGTAGPTFYGSYLGLPASVRNVARTFTKLTIDPNGDYTLTDSNGESYTFTPTTGKQQAA
jgi:hypothetical protein